MTQLIWLVPLFPLIGFLINGLGSKKLAKGTSATIACAAVLLSFLLSVAIFFEMKAAGKGTLVTLFDWISAGTLKVNFAFWVDALSSLFLLIITGIGFLIHLYSAGYMHHDEGHNRYFAYLNLFVFFMLLLVLGSSYLMMFVGWEGVGLCSYLLIGFWFKKTEYNNAAKKAFIMNRIGDLGFLLGMLLIFVTFGSLSYNEVFGVVQSPNASFMGSWQATAICLLLFVGAMGKSAQLPLYTWLPDAMAGPTPVSALIHAATMVTAGIYMIARSSVLYNLSPLALEVVMWVGILTALFAATIGLLQNDIKKVLAYSTVSQLGYMFVALGVGAYSSGVFHVTTHAFFKALLFLGAGSVIHAMSGEQDIRKMGDLKKHLPITYWTFLIGTLAIAGFPLLSGFFSKDEILAHTYEHNKLVWLLAVIGSALTAFYMFRLFFLTFHGSFRGTEHQKSHLHESPVSMTIPLIVLASLSVVGGFMNIPEVFHGNHWLKTFLGSAISEKSLSLSHSTEYMLMGVAVVVGLLVIGAAYVVYIQKNNLPETQDEKLSGFAKVVYNKYYVDELYANLITKPLNGLSNFAYRFVERSGIDGLVNSIGNGVNGSSSLLRLLQTGNLGFYLFAMVVGIILILFTKSF